MKSRNYITQLQHNDSVEQYQDFLRSLTVGDRERITQLMRDINLNGYNLVYIFELAQMDANDHILVPTICKYIGKFDHPGISESLMLYLAVKGFSEATETLIREFERTDITIPENRRAWEDADRSRYRQSAAYALLEIGDIKYEEKYIELVNNPAIHKESYNLVQLLGKLKSNKSITTLVGCLHDSSISIQLSAIKALGEFGGRIDLSRHLEPLICNTNKQIADAAKRAIHKLRGSVANNADNSR